MKMDKQHRLTIPDFIRKAVKVEEGEVYYLEFKKDNEFALKKSTEGKIIERVKIDDHGRFIVPRSVTDIFDTKIIMYFVEGKNEIGISIFKENT